MGKITLAFYVQNQGDGSASVRFYESEEVAKFAENFDNLAYDSGWAESSVDTITLEGDNIKVSDEDRKYIQSKADLIEEIKRDLDSDWIEEDVVDQIKELLKELEGDSTEEGM